MEGTPGARAEAQSRALGPAQDHYPTPEPRHVSLAAHSFHSPRLKCMMARKLIEGPQCMHRVGLGCAGLTSVNI